MLFDLQLLPRIQIGIRGIWIRLTVLVEKDTEGFGELEILVEKAREGLLTSSEAAKGQASTQPVQRSGGHGFQHLISYLRLHIGCGHRNFL